VLITLFWLGLCYGLAVFVPNVADVLALCGATCSTSVMYLFPAIFYLKLEHRLNEERDSPSRQRRKWGAWFLLFWGTFMCIFGTAISIKDFIEE